MIIEIRYSSRDMPTSKLSWLSILFTLRKTNATAKGLCRMLCAFLLGAFWLWRAVYTGLFWDRLPA